MNSPMVSSSSFDELQKFYRKLSETSARSDHLFDEAVQKGDISGLCAVTFNLRELTEQFKEEAGHHFVELPDKRALLKTEYEGLKEFATENGKDIKDILENVTIEDCSVVKAWLLSADLTTLTGLEVLTQLEEVSITGNPRLVSLDGVPTARLRTLYAKQCGLISIEAIKDANNLEVLVLNENCDLLSLDGAPTTNLRVLAASSCGLTSIEALLGADPLEKVDVTNNSNIPKEQLNKLSDQIVQIGGWLLS